MWFTKRLLMKEKGPGNSSVRPLSETRKKQMNGFVILWVKNIAGGGFFPKVPFGVFVLEQGTTCNWCLYFSSRKRAATLKENLHVPRCLIPSTASYFPLTCAENKKFQSSKLTEQLIIKCSVYRQSKWQQIKENSSCTVVFKQSLPMLLTLPIHLLIGQRT